MERQYRFITCPHCGREFQRIDFCGARHNITCNTEEALAEFYAQETNDED